jgi:hypothetical protein
MNTETISVVGTDEERQAFEKAFGIEELSENQRTIVYGSCLGAFLIGYRAGKAVEKKVTAHLSALVSECEELAKKLDYPEAWDAKLFPTIGSAVINAIEMRDLAIQRLDGEIAQLEYERQQEKSRGAFYTMDQMRDYSAAFLTTRFYSIINIFEKKISEWENMRDRFQDNANLNGTSVYKLHAEELRTLVENAKAYGARSFQKRATEWAKRCFGERLAMDIQERNFRFAEEAIELVQACGMKRSEVERAVDYVYGRPAGVTRQEVGGVYTTFALLCEAHGINMVGEGERDLMEIDNPEKTEAIRKKRDKKPSFAS